MSWQLIVEKSKLWLDQDNTITPVITTKLHLLTPATKEELEGNFLQYFISWTN